MQRKVFCKFVVGDYSARKGKAREDVYSIGKFRIGDGDKNGNRLAGLLSPWKLAVQKKKRSSLDMWVLKRHDMCGDRAYNA